MTHHLTEDQIRRAEDAHQDALADQAYTEILAHPETVVDAPDLFGDPLKPRHSEALRLQTSPESGEVYFRLSHKNYDPEGVKISHRAGNFGRVRLLMRGAVLFLNRDQTKFLLSQWRQLTKQTGLASGWRIQRSYFSDHEASDF